MSDNGGYGQCKQRYDRLELLALQNMVPANDPLIRDLDWVRDYVRQDQDGNKHRFKPKRRRGRRAGVRVRLRKRGDRPPLPTIVFGNVRSVRNKIDELAANCRFNSEYKNSSVIGLTETWLESKDSDGTVNIDGFSLIRGDREGTSKSHGGGVCFYVNDRWCKNITVKDVYCDDNIELLTISCRPYYLPREFNNVYMMIVYIPPNGNFTQASETLADHVHLIDDYCPNGISLILGDFNGCDISDQLPHYQQFVDCPTRGDRTLDLIFCNIKSAYRTIRRPPLGNSDHNMIFCMPTYVQKLKVEKWKKIEIKQWSDESIDNLKACFDCTDWNALIDESCDLDYNVDVVSCYINFCTDLNVPTKSVKVFSNNKPWITKDVKVVINKKKRALSCDRVSLKEVQKDLNEKISSAKHLYKQKIEGLFKSRHTKDAWKGLKYLSGHSSKSCMIEPDDTSTFVNQLNEFYVRFDGDDCQAECEEMLNVVHGIRSERIVMSENDVLLALNSAKPGKARGPDKVCPRVVKACKYQLLSPLHALYQTSLDQCIVPSSWKTSEVVPVPKCKIPKNMNDLRPIALTSVLMKCLESFVKRYLCNQVKHLCDVFQFAYKKGGGVDDAVITLLEIICSHLDRPRSYSRVLFIDFSSAFNTIKPHILLQKLVAMNLNSNIIRWIYDYLTRRPQYVKMGGFLSDLICTYTGAPQGCVLSPFLFTLYTNDCLSSFNNCSILKYADDTVIIGNVMNNDISDYSGQVDTFVEWCDSHFLNLNVNKTMEMIIDFRRNRDAHDSIAIKEESVKVVNCYKYLGVMIDDNLNFSENIHHVYKKCLQRVRYLRELANLRIDTVILTLFYKSIIESVLSFCILSWYGSSNKKDLKKLCKIIKIGQRLGIKTQNLQEIFNDSCLKMASKIMGNMDHPLNNCYMYLNSGRRLMVPKHRTSRYGKTFVPSSIKYFNYVNSKR